jgi:hypothetical protein
VPLVLVVIGWHYFWCRTLDAAYTKLRARAALRLHLVVPVAGLRHARRRRQGVPRRRLHRRSLAAFLAEYLNRTGSIILILTLLFAAIILSTQFSFGRLFARCRRWPRALGGAAAARARARREAAATSSARR